MSAWAWLVALLGMAAWSWGRLVEIQVDFGREIYVAWQLAEGKRLYADLVYYYGPLSPYFNALLFDLFGVSLRTLMVGNLVIAGLITVVLYLLFRGWADAFAETIASLVFPLLFACGTYGPPKIFHYICPYSHAATHGLLLGLVSILLAGRVNRVADATQRLPVRPGHRSGIPDQARAVRGRRGGGPVRLVPDRLAAPPDALVRLAWWPPG